MLEATGMTQRQAALVVSSRLSDAVGKDRAKRILLGYPPS